MTDRPAFADRVVVGFDGSYEAELAATWAARYAVRTGRGVILVRAQAARALPALDPMAPWHAASVEALARPSIVDVLVETLERTEAALRREYAGLRVETWVSPDTAWETLVEASDEAAALVIGSRRREPVESILTGSTVERVAANTNCPLVVVPADDPDWTGQPVLVATDASDTSAAAVEFGFELADLLGVPLTALTACHPRTLAHQSFGLAPSEAELFHDVAVQLEESLEPFRSAYPDVVVEERVAFGDPVETILDAAEDHSLLVCGSRGQGYLRGSFFGSTSRESLRRATRPAAVVRPAVRADY